MGVSCSVLLLFLTSWFSDTLYKALCPCHAELILHSCSLFLAVPPPLLPLQLFDESVAMQAVRLERQQFLQRGHLKKLRDFAEEFSLQPNSLNASGETQQSAERTSMNSQRSSTNVSMGMVSL